MIELKRAWIIAPSQLTLGKAIGSGGFGDVYQGKWGELTVAIKRVRAEWVDLTSDEFDTEISLMRVAR